MKTLAEMTAEVRALNTAKGWRTGDNTYGDYNALLHSEISEMLEAYRDHRLEPYTTPAGKPDAAETERDRLRPIAEAARAFIAHPERPESMDPNDAHEWDCEGERLYHALRNAVLGEEAPNAQP